MSKPEVEEAPAAAEPEAVTFDLTVVEFCARKSVTERRVELLAAFAASEARAGVVKDSTEQFEARFEAFATKPA